jgi:chromosome segregation ATPase
MEIDLDDAKVLLRHYRQRIASLEGTVARLNGVETENTQLKQRTVELEELVARSNGANTEEEYRQRITELEELVAGVRAQLQDKTAEVDGLMQRVAELRAQQAQTQATNASDRNDEMEM